MAILRRCLDYLRPKLPPQLLAEVEQALERKQAETCTRAFGNLLLWVDTVGCTTEPAAGRLQPPEEPQTEVAQPATAEPVDQAAWQATINFYTGGIADDRLQQVAAIVAQRDLSVDERLQKINDILPIPATASLQDVADLFGVTRQAVHQTDWYQHNRAGEGESKKEQRRRRLSERAKLCPPDPDRD